MILVFFSTDLTTNSETTDLNFHVFGQLGTYFNKFVKQTQACNNSHKKLSNSLVLKRKNCHLTILLPYWETGVVEQGVQVNLHIFPGIAIKLFPSSLLPPLKNEFFDLATATMFSSRSKMHAAMRWTPKCKMFVSKRLRKSTLG